jgi:hypothetical protein
LFFPAASLFALQVSSATTPVPDSLSFLDRSAEQRQKVPLDVRKNYFNFKASAGDGKRAQVRLFQNCLRHGDIAMAAKRPNLL